MQYKIWHIKIHYPKSDQKYLDIKKKEHNGKKHVSSSK